MKYLLARYAPMSGNEIAVVVLDDEATAVIDQRAEELQGLKCRPVQVVFADRSPAFIEEPENVWEGHKETEGHLDGQYMFFEGEGFYHMGWAKEEDGVLLETTPIPVDAIRYSAETEDCTSSPTL